MGRYVDEEAVKEEGADGSSVIKRRLSVLEFRGWIPDLSTFSLRTVLYITSVTIRVLMNKIR